jgi:hypothetical protein
MCDRIVLLKVIERAATIARIECVIPDTGETFLRLVVNGLERERVSFGVQPLSAGRERVDGWTRQIDEEFQN